MVEDKIKLLIEDKAFRKKPVVLKVKVAEN